MTSGRVQHHRAERSGGEYCDGEQTCNKRIERFTRGSDEWTADAR